MAVITKEIIRSIGPDTLDAQIEVLRMLDPVKNLVKASALRREDRDDAADMEIMKARNLFTLMLKALGGVPNS